MPLAHCVATGNGRNRGELHVDALGSVLFSVSVAVGSSVPSGVVPRLSFFWSFSCCFFFLVSSRLRFACR
jgi:hypothetical protein